MFFFKWRSTGHMHAKGRRCKSQTECMCIVVNRSVHAGHLHKDREKERGGFRQYVLYSE